MSKNISVCVNYQIIERMNKFLVRESDITQPSLTIHLTPYHVKFYNSIKKGDRSYFIIHIIKEFLELLEQENDIRKMFQSKGEFFRCALVYYRLLKNKKNIKNNELMTCIINGNIPIGNIYHPDGDWKNKYQEEEMKRYHLLEKIYDKVWLFYSKKQIASNFERFFEAYKSGLLDEKLTTEKQIRRLKLLIENGH